MVCLNIISLNVRGLREPVKRRSVFEFYRKRCHILCIQETHSIQDDEKIWTAEWGGRVFFSHGNSNARGVAMLIRRDVPVSVDEIKEIGSNGRCIVLKLRHEFFVVAVANIYAPNVDTPSFFEEVFNVTFNQNSELIVVGDYNTTLNPDIDRSNSCHNNPRSTACIKMKIEEMSLCEIWRSHNTGVRRYSWYRSLQKNCLQMSRIDYAVVSHGLSQMIHDTYYLNGLRSDHSAFLGVEVVSVDRGPGYWKMNTSLLKDTQYVAKINSLLSDLEISLNHKEPVEKWEIIKHEVRKASQAYAKTKSSDDSIVISQLSEYICAKEDEIEDLNEEDRSLLARTKAELDELINKRARGIMFRSKARWYMESERNTKYFFGLEKARYNAKTVVSIFNSEGHLIQDQTEVLKVQKEFYQELYTADPTVRYDMDIEPVVVEDGDIAKSDTPFTYEEFYNATKSMKNGSCPGNDGLPAEFYKCFWLQVNKNVMNAMEQVFQEKKMFQSARSGILNLIPKGEKDTRYLKNLRPITLLNTDYKIVEKCIANRMVPALEYIINEDQKGFLPNRRIAANIRRILDVVTGVQQENQPENMYVLSCDFLKCFDRVETESVLKGWRHLAFLNS